MLKTLALIFLAFPAYAGNLGAADSLMYGVREMAGPLEVKSKYSVHPGRFRTRNDDAAIAEFVNGLFLYKNLSRVRRMAKEKKIFARKFCIYREGNISGSGFEFWLPCQSPCDRFSCPL